MKGAGEHKNYMKKDKLWVRIWYFFILIVIAPVLYTVMFIDGIIENIKNKF